MPLSFWAFSINSARRLRIIGLRGDKVAAREAAIAAGVPVVPGSKGRIGRSIRNSFQSTSCAVTVSGSSAVAAVSQYSAADESGTLPGSDLPADLAAGDPEERARIAEALALATERMRLRRPPSPTRTRTSVPDSRETPAAVPASRADMAEQTSSTVTLEDDPELWLEFIDVLTETGMRGHAAEMTRRYRDAFPGRPLDPRHEALLEE